MTMSYNSWINARKNKKIDYDGRYGVQCVDLAKDYLYNCFGIRPGCWGNAHAYWDDFNKHKELTENFVRIANTPSFVPQKGDIMVWKKPLNGLYGHIAICDGNGNTRYFYSYDQNWTGKNEGTTRIKHNYNYVYGVLRPKNQLKLGVVNYQITADCLRVRAGSGLNYNIVARIYNKSIHTVTATKIVNGMLWGKISKGWIALKYAKRV